MQLTASRHHLMLTLAALFVLASVLGIVTCRLLPASQTAGAGQALIGGSFELTDHHGRTDTEASYADRYMPSA